MRKRRTSAVILFAVLLVAALAGAAAQVAPDATATGTAAAPGTGATATPESGKKAAEPQPPVRISADAAEYFNKESRVVFTGNVVAVQGDTTISAERMEVSFEKPASAEGKPAAGIGSPATAQRITRIVAENNVSFRQVDVDTGKERYATGEKGVYDVDQQFMTMSGNPRLWEGKNVIVGEEMIFHLVDKKVIVKGKVNLTVFPEELKEVKKP